MINSKYYPGVTFETHSNQKSFDMFYFEVSAK